MGHITLWTDFEISELKRLYITLFDGVYLSHRAIGAQIGKTRNAIIGKIHRLKLHRNEAIPVQGNDSRVRIVATRGARYSVRAAKTPPVAPPVMEGRSPYAIQIWEAHDGVCRYPIGHVGQEGFHLCGATTGGKPPYCAWHSALCFLPPEQRRKSVRPMYRTAWAR